MFNMVPFRDATVNWMAFYVSIEINYMELKFKIVLNIIIILNIFIIKYYYYIITFKMVFSC